MKQTPHFYYITYTIGNLGNSWNSGFSLYFKHRQYSITGREKLRGIVGILECKI
jgi:hypothetical protein